MKRWIKIVGIGLVMSLLHLFLFRMFKSPSVQGYLLPSRWIQTGSYDKVAFGIGWIGFTGMTAGYEWLDLRMPWKKTGKTVAYVACEWMLWCLYACEPLPHRLPIDSLLEVLKALLLFITQGVGIVLLLAREGKDYQRKPFIYGRAIVVYMEALAIFRLFAYRGLGIYGLDLGMTYLSLMWAVLLGAGVGLVFCLLHRYFKHQDKWKKTLVMTWGIFAPVVATFHSLFALIFQLAWIDILGRIGLDILAVWLATWIIVQWQVDQWIGADSTGH